MGVWLYICIYFTAYAILKELEWLLYKEKARTFTKESHSTDPYHTMFQLKVILPESKKQKKYTSEYG
ncbi:MAG: hypothetical protein K8R74_07620 [Bacteroidales bacterium]|nr:hypothetical protein [Bacteroidales bacterium]